MGWCGKMSGWCKYALVQRVAPVDYAAAKSEGVLVYAKELCPTMLRISQFNNRSVLRGHFLPTSRLAPGQVWTDSSGQQNVHIVKAEDGLVTYQVDATAQQVQNEDAFVFQSKYFLVLD